jgi:hypothetical protein
LPLAGFGRLLSYVLLHTGHSNDANKADHFTGRVDPKETLANVCLAAARTVVALGCSHSPNLEIDLETTT